MFSDKIIFLFTLILFALLLTSFGCGCGDDDDDDSSGDDDDDNDDDDTTGDDDDDDDDDDTTTVDWADISLESVNAPDEYSVSVTFDDNPGSDAAEVVSIYEITSPANGNLSVTGAQYDIPSRTVTLTTGKQKLGVTYTLTVNPGTKGNLTDDFMSADTAVFWAVDFSSSSFPQYQVTAYRAGVGDSVVIYIEQGWSVSDTATALTEFDDNIYPELTSRLIAAPDIDGNDRILILGLDGGSYYGGYFSAVNAYPESMTWPNWNEHSNEMEMVHINVVYGELGVQNIVPHEFQHLLYHERHSNNYTYYDYHDEGLAECAPHIVYGNNDYAYGFYKADPYGDIATGLSLVNWTWANYSNYAQAYMFWTYIASRLSGIDTYSDIFDLDVGSPSEVSTFLSTELGEDFSQVHRKQLLANYLMASTGEYGYNGMITGDAHIVPTVPTGTDSVDLPPFSGTYFKFGAGVTSVNLPRNTRSEHSLHRHRLGGQSGL